MALVVDNAALNSFNSDPTALDALRAAVEQGMQQLHAGVAQQHTWGHGPADGSAGTLGLQNAMSPTLGGIVRMFPIAPSARGVADARWVLLYDSTTAQLRGMVSDEALNAVRTATPAALVAAYCAPGATEMALQGSGKQAWAAVLTTLRAVPTLRTLRVFSPNAEHRATIAQRAVGLGIAATAVDSAEAAVRGAGVVAVCTNSRTPVVERGWLAPNAVVTSVASGQLPDDLVRYGRVVVSSRDEVPGSARPREPYASLAAKGAWAPATGIAADLGELAAGARLTPDGRPVLFEMAPLNVWDLAAAHWAVEQAAARGLGVKFGLS